MDELSPAQVILVGLDVHRAVALDGFLLALAEYHAKRVEDSLRDLVLDGENVFHVAVEFSRPQLIPVGDVDQLRTDAKPVPDLSHTPFENRRHLELPADLA